jgi:hypothetical protein
MLQSFFLQIDVAEIVLVPTKNSVVIDPVEFELPPR